MTGSSSRAGLLQLVQRLPTSGARAVEPFVRDGVTYLAVPQLAFDIAGQAPAMTAGDSDTDLLVFRWHDDRFELHQRLDVPGGEDAEHFEIDGRSFLATASLRRGKGPYEMQLDSTIFEWRDDRFEPFQKIATFAAKQWTFFEFEGRRFLALAQGVAHGPEPTAGAPSRIHEWDGERFVPFQDVASAWGYNWLFFEAGGKRWLAYADHAVPSRLMSWTGRDFADVQELEGQSGRAFCHFRVDGDDWLVFACLLEETWLMRWHDGRFERHQRLSGPGGRELAWIGSRDGGRLIQTNFIEGSREAPRPVLRSIVYAWRAGRLEAVDDFATVGGTDAAAFALPGEDGLAVANSLDATLRFSGETCIYRIDPGR